MTETPGRPGATSVVDAAGKLVGIFTDGDLRRLVEHGETDFTRPVSTAMGRNPRTVRPDALVGGRRARAPPGAHRPGAGGGRRRAARSGSSTCRTSSRPRSSERRARWPREPRAAPEPARPPAAAPPSARPRGARRDLPPAPRPRPHRRGRGQRLGPARRRTASSSPPSGVSNKGYLAPGDLVVVDARGAVAPGAAAPPPSPHAPRRLRGAPGRRAVVHAHPITAVALTVAGLPPPNDLVPEAAVTLGRDRRRAVRDARHRRGPRLARAAPGRATTSSCSSATARSRSGRTLAEAFDRMETLERVARVALAARLAGRCEPLPPAAVARVLAAAGRPPRT